MSNHTLGQLEVYGATLILGENKSRVVCQMSEPESESGMAEHDKPRIGSPNWQEICANAERIVRTWNAHDDLLAALKAIYEWQTTCLMPVGTSKKAMFDKAKAAIEKATKEGGD